MKKISTKLGKAFGGGLASLAALGNSFAAHAADLTNPSDVVDSLVDNQTGSTDLMSWIRNVLNLVIGLAGMVSVVMLIAAGYSFITAGGDEEKVQKATKTLTYAIIGLVICLISALVVQFVLKEVVAK